MQHSHDLHRPFVIHVYYIHEGHMKLVGQTFPYISSVKSLISNILEAKCEKIIRNNQDFYNCSLKVSVYCGLTVSDINKKS